MHASVALPLHYLCGFLVVLARVTGALIFVPIPGFRNGPEAARITLALVITVALFPVWPHFGDASPSIGQLLLYVAADAAFGITLGVCVAFLLEGFTLAAQVLALQAGYSYASTIDPNSQADSGVILVMIQLIASLLFFAFGIHHQLIRAFALSLDRFPPGHYFVSREMAESVVKLGSMMFSIALRLALPVVALLALVDVALALLGKVNSQLQLLTLAFPVKTILGLAVLAAIASMMPLLFESASGQTLTVLEGLLGRV